MQRRKLKNFSSNKSVSKFSRQTAIGKIGGTISDKNNSVSHHSSLGYDINTSDAGEATSRDVSPTSLDDRNEERTSHQDMPITNFVDNLLSKERKMNKKKTKREKLKATSSTEV